MAKEKMICPFSGKLCRECPIFRGRHYFLCYKDNYRGHLKEKRGKPKDIEKLSLRKTAKNIFHVKEVTVVNPIDPYSVEMPDIK